MNLNGSWWLIAKAAIVVLFLSFTFANPSLGGERADAASRYFKLGQETHVKGQYRKAIGYYEKALAIDREALGEKHPGTAKYYNNLGRAWRSLGRYRKAIGYFEKALAINRETLGERYPHTARDYSNLGQAWYALVHSCFN